jgi:MoaA/NifB/PqqE/SkfB family radical SAM enzyme
MCPRTGIQLAHLPLERLKDIINNPFLAQSVYYTFVGLGEPLLNPDIFKMAEYARSKNKIPVLFSNGQLLNKKMVERIIGAGFLRVYISIDSPVADTYKKIRGAELSRVVSGIKLLESAAKTVKSSCDVVITTVCSRANEKELLPMIDFAKDCGIKTIHFQHSEPSYVESAADPVWSANQIMHADFYKTWGRLSDQILRHAQENSIFVKIQDLPVRPKQRTCTQPWRSLFIRVNGDVCRCCVDLHPPLGNMFTTAIEQLWNSPAMQERRVLLEGTSLPPVCNFCTNF